MRRTYLIVLVLLAGACSKSKTSTPVPVIGGQTLLQRLKNNYDFSEFYNALQRVHLDTMLEGPGPFTLLVPDNTALQAQGITQDSLNRIDTGQLRKLLAYHILENNITYASIPQTIDYVYRNIEGLPLYFSVPVPGNTQTQPTGIQYLHVNGVQATTLDLVATNGVIQVLSSPLPYPVASVKTFLVNNPNYSMYVAALQHYGLLNQLDSAGPWMVFAPNNSAFANWNITMDTITAETRQTNYPWLWSAGIMPHELFFASDILDGPVEIGAGGYYLTTNYVIQFGYYGQAGLSWYRPNYIRVYAQGGVYSLGDYCTDVDPDHIAMNGVVQGLNGLPVYPDSTIVQP